MFMADLLIRDNQLGLLEMQADKTFIQIQEVITSGLLMDALFAQGIYSGYAGSLGALLGTKNHSYRNWKRSSQRAEAMERYILMDVIFGGMVLPLVDQANYLESRGELSEFSPSEIQPWIFTRRVFENVSTPFNRVRSYTEELSRAGRYDELVDAVTHLRNRPNKHDVPFKIRR